MNKRRQGLSRRGYAAHAGVSHVYVCKLIERRKIPVLADGSLDPVACDNARARNTVQGRGQRRLQRRQAARESECAASGHAECTGCGETFRCLDARACGSPDSSKFCCPQCGIDAAAGLSVSQVRRKIGRESRA
jgi:hypothetical protein